MDECVAESNYQPLHHFISHSPWDGQAVINEVAVQTQATFQRRAGRVGLLLDESGWAKAGRHSVGVARQYIGQLGKVENGQVGVFAALCQEDRVGLVGARLYLPAAWTDDPARCAAAGIPPAAQEYRSKPELAAAIIAQLEGKVAYEWVGGDALYGNSPFLREQLRAGAKSYVLDVGEQLGVYLEPPAPRPPVRKTKRGRAPTRWVSEAQPIVLKELVAKLEDAEWTPVNYREGTKGPLVREAVQFPVWLWQPANEGVVERAELLLSRELDGSEIKYSLCWEASGAAAELATSVWRQMQRYWVERAFQEVKEQLGLAQYQVRGWVGWEHHIALTLMALHYMLQTRVEAEEELPLLSCSDIKLMLARILRNKLRESAGISAAIGRRHELRRRDIARYTLRM